MSSPVLLHGDLHHDNILSAERAPWLAIDPKGLVGEPAYETGAWLRNSHPELLNSPHPARTLARRIDQLAAELNSERARIHGWAWRKRSSPPGGTLKTQASSTMPISPAPAY